MGKQTNTVKIRICNSKFQDEIVSAATDLPKLRIDGGDEAVPGGDVAVDEVHLLQEPRLVLLGGALAQRLHSDLLRLLRRRLPHRSILDQVEAVDSALVDLAEGTASCNPDRPV